jgi:hypothetical protein
MIKHINTLTPDSNKIEAHCVHVLTDEESTKRLSDAEFRFAKGYCDLKEKLLHTSFLEHVVCHVISAPYTTIANSL